MLTLTVKGSAELRDLARDLRRARDKTLRDNLRAAFKKAGDSTLKQVKHNMTSMQIKGYRTRRKPAFTDRRPGTNIRQRIAAATRLSIRTSGTDPRVAFEVATDRLGKARHVPWHLDTGKKFRHPIMGNRSSWAANSGTPWFYNEIKSDLDVFATECDTAIDKTIQTIERG